jgi:hypothetical protein
LRRVLSAAILTALALLQPQAEPPPQEQEPDEGGLFGKGVSFIPIPFFSTSRNSGHSFGFLPVLMFENDKGEFTRLIVPKYEYFEHSLSNYSVDYFGYPDEHSFYDLFGLIAVKDDQRLVAEYRNTRLWDTPWGVYGQLFYNVSNSERFFGLGPSTREDDESNFLLRERRVKLGVGYRAFEHGTIYFQERVRWYGLSRGGLRDLPYLKDRFPEVPGIDEGVVLHEEIQFLYDSRDFEKTPTRGVTASVWLSVRHYFGDEGRARSTAPIWGGGADAAVVLPMSDDGMFTTAARIRYESIKGNSGDVPFLEMISLGGNNLRGYGENRFYDLNGIVFSVEERIAVWDVMLFGVKGTIQIAPFIDCGKVFRSARKQFLSRANRDYQFTYGAAFRGIVAPFIVGRVEFGIGEDGLAAFVGLDYPY